MDMDETPILPMRVPKTSNGNPGLITAQPPTLLGFGVPASDTEGGMGDSHLHTLYGTHLVLAGKVFGWPLQERPRLAHPCSQHR